MSAISLSSSPPPPEQPPLLQAPDDSCTANEKPAAVTPQDVPDAMGWSVRSWTTKEQWSYLNSRINEYNEARSANKLAHFYDEVTNDWVKQGWTYENVGTKKIALPRPGEEKDYAMKTKVNARAVSTKSIFD